MTVLDPVVAADKLVVIGDSAGGHMALTLLQRLQAEGLPQPALCIGLCAWSDIGDCGASLSGTDRFNLVQGWMALQFGKWLDPDGRYARSRWLQCQLVHSLCKSTTKIIENAALITVPCRVFASQATT